MQAPFSRLPMRFTRNLVQAFHQYVCCCVSDDADGNFPTSVAGAPKASCWMEEPDHGLDAGHVAR
jgi:hypothetical protein